MPDTFDELDRALQIVNKKDGVAGYGVENHWGWTFIPFLQGFGGNVFRNPPDDLMPALDTPEAAEAAEFFAKLINSYGPPAAAGYTYDQVTEAQRAGRINYAPQNHVFLALLGEAGSKVTTTSNFSMVPQGPKGRFPGIASHGWGIPVGAKNKDGVLGVHQVGDDQGDGAAPGREARARLGDAPVAAQLAGLQAEDGDQRRRYRTALPRHHRVSPAAAT